MEKQQTLESSGGTLKKAIQVFQAGRIRDTYQDIAQKPEYTNLTEFFFHQIYGPQDFEFRNDSIKSLHGKLSGFLKGEIIDAVGKVIQLNDLTDELDEKMAVKLSGNFSGERLSMETYASLYRSLDNYDQRVQQIDLMIEATTGIHRISQMWMVGWTLKAVKQAAQVAGFGKIAEFLVEGYDAFQSVKNIRFFTETVESREKKLNDELFGK